MPYYDEEMDGVREYAERLPVAITLCTNGRLAITAINQGGYDSTAVDLLDLLGWIKNNRPDLWDAA